MASRRNPRQSDIARHAGVSQATVSYVLNGRAGEHAIPEATRERVLDAVRELGYVPNVAARSLRTGRTGLIGVHTFESVFPVTQDDYYNDFLVGIEEQAVESGVDLVLFASTRGRDGLRRNDGSGASRLRLADGTVLLGLERDDAQLDQLAKERYPFVLIGRRSDAVDPMPFVAADYDGALRSVLRPLADLGHRSTLYIGRRARAIPHVDRYSSYSAHAAELGLNAAPAKFIEPGEVTADMMTAVLRAGVTAVIVESHQLASALVSACESAAIDIPGELSFVSLDVAPRGVDDEWWSRIEVPRRELGRRSVSMLLELLDGDIGRDHSELVPCRPPSSASISVPVRRT